MECCCADETVLARINQYSVEKSRHAQVATDRVLRFYQTFCSSVPAFSFYVGVERRRER